VGRGEEREEHGWQLKDEEGNRRGEEKRGEERSGGRRGERETGKR
jgi:hypothetical protein